MTTDALLDVRGLAKSFGALRATDGVDLDVREGETHAIIGPNGAGKTTLIGQLSGTLRPDAGRIRFAGEDITALAAPARSRKGLARSFQITSIYREFTALDNVALAVQAHAGHSFRFWRPARSEPELRDPARAILEEVGLGARADVHAANLAHGEQRQLEIAMVLATRPRLMLLDEPVAGMGIDESQRMVAVPRRPEGEAHDDPRRARHGRASSRSPTASRCSSTGASSRAAHPRRSAPTPKCAPPISARTRGADAARPGPRDGVRAEPGALRLST